MVSYLEVLSAEHIYSLIAASDLIPVVETGLQELSRGATINPHRMVLATDNGTLVVMPSYIPALQALVTKSVTIFPDNGGKGLPTTQGVVTLFDVANGQPLCILDGAAITALRTGAVAAFGTERMVAGGRKKVAMIGTGAQARGAAEALVGSKKLSIETMSVYSRQPANRERFIQDLVDRFKGLRWSAPRLIAVQSPEDAVADADIIVTATTSKMPVFSPDGVKNGAHVTAIGAYTADGTEVPPELFQRVAAIGIESIGAAKQEAGDIIQAIARGYAHWEDVFEVGAMKAPAVTNASGVTVFKSVGVAALDAAVSKYVWDRWSEHVISKG